MNRLQHIALTKVRGVGPKTGRMLLSYFDSLDDLFSASRKDLSSIPSLQKAVIDAILSKEALEEAEAELTFLEKHAIQTLWIESEDYPYRLKQCEDAPLLLYFKGKADHNPTKSISIVGTRNATPYGKQLCDSLVAALQGMDVQIVSGLAQGIDGYAHRAALRHHIPTVGVLGHGLQMIYPANHRDLAARMIDNGGLITEFSSTTKPERMHFPARNRIIAGLADVTIVIEAAIKGGALITAEIANSYNRDVCAFPGAIGQAYSAGCNYLIKTNRAHLIRHADDLLYIMGWEQKPKTAGLQLDLLPTALTKDEERVYQFLREREQALLDDIANELNWSMSKLALVLLKMEMSGHIISLPGKKYQNIN